MELVLNILKDKAVNFCRISNTNNNNDDNSNRNNKNNSSFQINEKEIIFYFKIITFLYYFKFHSLCQIKIYHSCCMLNKSIIIYQIHLFRYKYSNT